MLTPIGESTYKIPRLINATKDIFRLVFICNFHNIAIGKVAKNMSLVIETTGKTASSDKDLTRLSVWEVYSPALAHPNACITSTDQQIVWTESSQITLMFSH